MAMSRSARKCKRIMGSPWSSRSVGPLSACPGNSSCRFASRKFATDLVVVTARFFGIAEFVVAQAELEQCVGDLVSQGEPNHDPFELFGRAREITLREEALATPVGGVVGVRMIGPFDEK